MHIDHYDLTFAELFNLWVNTRDIDYLYSQINDTSKDCETNVYFINQEIIDDFVQHHNSHTHLRAVSKIANLSILRRNILLTYFIHK